MPFELAVGSKYERANEILRVRKLNSFHQGGNLRCLQTCAFSLRDGHRAAVRPRGQDDREPDPVESRDIGKPGDAEQVFDRHYLLQRLDGISCALRSLEKALAVSSISSRHHDTNPYWRAFAIAPRHRQRHREPPASRSILRFRAREQWRAESLGRPKYRRTSLHLWTV